MIGSPRALSNKYYNLDDNAVVFYSLFVLLRPGGYGPLCILQELKRGTGWEWLHNTLTEYYYLKYGEEWKTTELSENWNSCREVNLWWASCTWTIPQGINLKFYMLVLSEQNPYFFVLCAICPLYFLTEIRICNQCESHILEINTFCGFSWSTTEFHIVIMQVKFW